MTITLQGGTLMTNIKFTPHKVYEVLEDYHWKVKEIERLRDQLDDVEFSGCATYGEDAGMPKAPGGVSKAVEKEVERRDKKRQRLEEYEKEVETINERMKRLKSQKEFVVLDCLMDGLTLTGLSKHLNISRTSARELRDNIVQKLAD